MKDYEHFAERTLFPIVVIVFAAAISAAFIYNIEHPAVEVFLDFVFRKVWR